MTFTLGLLTSSASEVDWSRELMIGWIAIALGLSLLEIWLAGGFSSKGEKSLLDTVSTGSGQ